MSAGATGLWQINAPTGITIDSVWIPLVESSGLVPSTADGWRAGDYWSGASTTWGPHTTDVGQGQDSPMNTSYYGFKLYCYASSCRRGCRGEEPLPHPTHVCWARTISTTSWSTKIVSGAPSILVCW